MNNVQQLKLEIISKMDLLDQKQLEEVDSMIRQMTPNGDNNIGELYAEAQLKYGDTLQKLAN